VPASPLSLPGQAAGGEPRLPLVARALPDLPALDRELDYLVPAELADEVRVGAVVRLPLQGRRVRGWVTAYPVAPAEGVALRPIARVSGWGPPPELVELASWAAWRWAGRRRSLLVSATPRAVVKQLPAPASGALRHLAGSPPPAGPRGRAARALVEAAWQSRQPGDRPHLLRLPPDYDGTELVSALAERGPVLVVAPSEERAAAGAAALRRRGWAVALLPGDWAQARAGADVVIGSRGAAWGPCPGMASAVVLDAHDDGLVQGTTPCWDAPDVVAERARRAGAACLWVSSCPSLEMLAARPRLHLPSRSEERQGWAVLQVVDMRGVDPRQGLYSEALVRQLRGGARVVCVLNRKGRAALLACGACRELARCEDCGGAVLLEGGRLRCRRCGATRPEVCAACGSDRLAVLRVGVSGAVEQVGALAGRPVGEVTATTRELPPTPVIVGTQAALYRERELRATGGVDVVGFLDFDQELLAPSYRAGEQALALLARAARVVGGRRRGGQVLVQTRLPAHPVLRAALLADPAVLSAAEEPVRQSLRLPPYSSVASLSGPGAAAFARELARASAEVEVKGPDRAGRFLVRAPGPACLADALAATRRPRERVRVDVGAVWS